MKTLSLENLQADGACSAGIEWITPLLLAGGPTAQQWAKHSGWLMWAVRNDYALDVDAIALANVTLAQTLMSHAPERLSEATLGALIERDPECARLAIQECAQRLSDDTFLALVHGDPECADTAFRVCRDRLPEPIRARIAAEYAADKAAFIAALA